MYVMYVRTTQAKREGYIIASSMTLPPLYLTNVSNRINGLSKMKFGPKLFTHHSTKYCYVYKLAFVILPQISRNMYSFQHRLNYKLFVYVFFCSFNHYSVMYQVCFGKINPN